MAESIGVGAGEVVRSWLPEYSKPAMPFLDHHTLSSAHMLPTIVRGKANGIGSCSFVTFPDNYKEHYTLMTEANAKNSTFDHTHQLSFPISWALPMPLVSGSA